MPRGRRARRAKTETAVTPPAVSTMEAPVTPTTPSPGTPEWDKAHLAYLQDELHKYEASNPEAATRLRQRIKEHRAKMK